MNITKICPRCSVPGIEVGIEAVSNLLKGPKKAACSEKHWVCPNPACDVTYFSKTSTFLTADVKVDFWFKNPSLDTPVCYCSGLSRGEIINAVKNGCNSIAAVQAYTKKNITGNCSRENPLGNCCREVFLFAIRQAKD